MPWEKCYPFPLFSTICIRLCSLWVWGGFLCKYFDVIASQATQEGEQCFFLFKRQMQRRDPRVLPFGACPASVIVFDHLFQSQQGAIVHVWCGQRDVTQRRCLVAPQVCGIKRDFVSSQVFTWRSEDFVHLGTRHLHDESTAQIHVYGLLGNKLQLCRACIVEPLVGEQSRLFADCMAGKTLPLAGEDLEASFDLVTYRSAVTSEMP